MLSFSVCKNDQKLVVYVEGIQNSIVVGFLHIVRFVEAGISLDNYITEKQVPRSNLPTSIIKLN